MAFPVLQGQAVFGGDVLRGQHPVIGQLFAAQTHHHDLTAEVGVADDVGDGPDGNVGQRGIDGHAAAIGVGDGHHTVHVGVLGQQFLFDPLHGHLDHTGGALHGGHDAQQVAGTGRADFVAVAHPGRAGRGGQLVRGLDAGAPGHIGQSRALGQVQHMFVDPAAGRDIVLCVAQNYAVAEDLAAGRDIHQCDLVGLGNLLPGDDAAFQRGACGQVVDSDHDIVLILDLDGQSFHIVTTFSLFFFDVFRTPERRSGFCPEYTGEVYKRQWAKCWETGGFFVGCDKKQGTFQYGTEFEIWNREIKRKNDKNTGCVSFPATLDRAKQK